jgi:iron(III) transport system ATP-binding protein
MSNTILEVNKLSHAYGTKKVLKQVSFSLGAGERLGIAGASGSGKSTLLKILAGQLALQKGEVAFKGDALALGKNELLPGHATIKLLNQDFDLAPVLNVDENISRKGRDLSQTALKKHLGRSHNKLELGALKSQIAQELSGGQQQRTALAATLAAKPQLLLLDEPFSQLDYALKSKVLHYLQTDYPELAQVLVTHEPSDLLAHTDRLLILRQGRIEQEGSPYTIFHFPKNQYVAEVTGPINSLSPAAQSYLQTKETLLRPLHFVFKKGGFKAQVLSTYLNGYATFAELQLLNDGKTVLTVQLPSAISLQKEDMVYLGIKKPSK